MNKLDMCVNYINAGYALILLHDVSCGRCSCGDLTVEHTWKQGGKHPWDRHWPKTYIKDVTAISGKLAQNPNANIGIVTGEPSGIWVLDIDPGNGGYESLLALTEQHGGLPMTHTVQTGSGGTHYYWKMPADVEIKNSTGTVAKGIDVRSNGGQVVAPPSVSGKGAYMIVRECEPATAPDWLLGLVMASSGYEHARTFEGEPPRTGEVGRRETAYAATVIRDECERLARTEEGMRNATAFTVACRLIELINPGWISASVAQSAYLAACEQLDCAGGGRFPESEAWKCWQHAASKVGTRCARLPPDMMHGTEFVPPASGTAQPSVVFLDPGEVTADTPATVPATSASLRELVMPTSAVRQLPPPVPLVSGLLYQDTIAWMIGASGCYKSFVAIDLAAHVAKGAPWQGKKTAPGRVLFIAGEGLGGLPLRIRAWDAEYGEGIGPMDGVDFIPRAVQVTDTATWNQLLEIVSIEKYALVVIDTQSRATIGLKENDNQDMMRYVCAVDALRIASGGACILTIHHTGRNGTDARGASSIDGAQDTELHVKRGEGFTATLSIDKQKDGDCTDEIELKLRSVVLDMNLDTGEDISSLVIAKPASEETPKRKLTREEILTERATALWQLVYDEFNEGDGGTRADFRKHFGELSSVSGMRASKLDRAFNTAWQRLVKLGLLARKEGAQRFKVVVREPVPADPLTENLGSKATDPPAGWVRYTPDDDVDKKVDEKDKPADSGQV